MNSLQEQLKTLELKVHDLPPSLMNDSIAVEIFFRRGEGEGQYKLFEAGRRGLKPNDASYIIDILLNHQTDDIMKWRRTVLREWQNRWMAIKEEIELQTKRQEESRIAAYEEMLLRKVEIVRVAFALDTALRGDPSRTELSRLLKQLPEIFHHMVAQYREDRDKISAIKRKHIQRSVAQRLLDVLDVLGGVDSGINLPQDFGEKVFAELKGKQPRGKINLTAEAAFFVFQCDDEADFKDLGGKSIEAGGAYGRFHYSGEYMVPSLLINGRYRKPTYEHERQHWLNDLLGFEISEEFGSIKNEVLASIRGGNRRINYISDSTLYKYLFPNMSEAEEKKVKQLLGDIENALTHVPQEINPGVLVYLLIELPLEKFPDFIKYLFAKCPPQSLSLIV